MLFSSYLAAHDHPFTAPSSNSRLLRVSTGPDSCLAMFSARRRSALLAQKVVDAYHAAGSAILEARFPWRYQPLADDALSINADMNVQVRKGHSRLRFWKLFVYTTCFLFLLTAFAVYTRSKSILSTTTTAFGLARADISKDEFIAALLREPVEGLLDPDPIRKKCDETKFQEGLVWHCAAVVGGIGNVANMLLNCVRYAIEAGGMFLFFRLY
jgi:hypothetical protein